jgi:DNA-binding GntR family transcriptional regulator
MNRTLERLEPVARKTRVAAMLRQVILSGTARDVA